MSRNAKIWSAWLLASCVGAALLVAGMLHGGQIRTQFLPGKTSSGHHQIELACEACHTSPMGGREVLQAACTGCHAAELKMARDTHPARKFTDPRNADRLSVLRADQCVTCHREHKPEITRAMGVTLPDDFCALCHQEVAKERPSHEGVAFSSCAASGCHKFHDNRALYEAFLVKHSNEPVVRLKAYVKLLRDAPEPPPANAALTLVQANAPVAKSADATTNADWLATSHAKAGVNCSGCHARGAAKDVDQSARMALADWVEKPGQEVCAACHSAEMRGFVGGKHGMRLAKNMKSESAGLGGVFQDKPLSPMRPELARATMDPSAHGKDITCTSCHSAHRFDVAKAPVEACLGCHADEHSKRYVGSPHHKLWVAEREGRGGRGSGVSCASCHMPRVEQEDASGVERIVANHNQNDNLRPNEKMIRSVCLDCHGLGFAMDALADRKLIQRNFSGAPAVHVKSIDWAVKRQGGDERK